MTTKPTEEKEYTGEIKLTFTFKRKTKADNEGVAKFWLSRELTGEMLHNPDFWRSLPIENISMEVEIIE